MKPARQRILPEVQTAVYTNSARRCALCFSVDGDLTEKRGQIAHLDRNRNNPAEDNLAFMCLDHHSLFDSKTSQHKNYSISEVKAARTKLYEFVANRNHSPATAQPYLQAEADRKILRDIMEKVPSNGSIGFLRINNFAGFSFERKQLHDIRFFLNERNGPEHEFLDSELEIARKKFDKECEALMHVIALNTFYKHEGLYSVPEEWEWENPSRFRDTVDKIHTAAKAVCNAYDELVRFARKKLAV
jgi:hypothetical protein